MPGSNTMNPADDSTGADQPAPPVKRRRWLRRLVIGFLLLIILLAVLIGLAPKIASTKAVSDYAILIANDQLQGSIELEGLSASWGGPTELRGLRVLDPDGREVVNVAKITCAGGVWRMATSTKAFVELRIEAPRVNIHMTADNGMTLAQAFQPRKPSTGGGDSGGGGVGSPPELVGRIVISNGAVHVSKDDGAAFDVKDLNGEFQVDSLSDFAGKLDLTIADGGKIALETAIRGLISDGEFDVKNATGSLHLSTAGDIDIGALASFAAPDGGMSGKANLKVDLTLDSGDIQGEFATNVLGLRAMKGPADPLDLGLSGSLSTMAEKLTVQANLSGDATASVAGWYHLENGGFQADLDLPQTQLDFIANQAKAFGLDELARYDGALRLQANAARAGADQPITAAGGIVAQNLTVDGQPLAGSEASVSWTGVVLAADVSDIEVARADLKSGPASLTAQDIRWRSGDKLVLEGKVNGSADLARCFRSVGLITKSEEPPAIAGRLSVDTNFNTAGGKITLAGSGQIDQLAVGTGDQAVRENRVGFEYDALIDEQAERITVNRGRLTSTPLSADISGTIDKYTTTQELDLAGDYAASWKELTAILHELAPATAENVAVVGKSRSRFKITGPLNQKGEQPTFESIDSGLDVGWKAAEVYGVPMGIAKLSPVLRDGQLIVPEATISAAGGKVNLGAVIDLRGPEPTLKLPKRLKLLQDVAVTPELAGSLLSRINPIFLHLTRVEGAVRLDLRDVVLPLGETLKTAGKGSGRLDLLEMKVQPGGLLAELLALGGLTKTEMHVVRVSGLNFQLEDGRLTYKDFTLAFADGGYDLKFYGSVGLDETLDLVVSLPVHAALLERLGVRGPTVEYARQLAGSRIDIPLVGTRLRPKLDLAKVDVKPLIERAVKKTSEKAAGNLLRGLLSGDDKKDDDQKKKKKPGRKSRKNKKRRP